MMVSDVLRDAIEATGDFRLVTNGFVAGADVLLRGRLVALEEVDREREPVARARGARPAATGRAVGARHLGLAGAPGGRRGRSHARGRGACAVSSDRRDQRRASPSPSSRRRARPARRARRSSAARNLSLTARGACRQTLRGLLKALPLCVTMFLAFWNLPVVQWMVWRDASSTERMDDLWSLRAAREGRHGRDGRDLSRQDIWRGGLRERVRHQADPTLARRRQRVRRHVHQRGQDRGEPLPRQHRTGL